MTGLLVVFVLGALVGSAFPAFRCDPALLSRIVKKPERESEPWDSRFW